MFQVAAPNPRFSLLACASAAAAPRLSTAAVKLGNFRNRVLVNTTGGECSRSELHKTLNLQPYGEEELEVTRPAMFSKSK